jgi:hypothetical protein
VISALSRGNARRYVLDANALIGFFESRPGSAQKVRQLLGEAARQDVPMLMSAVNWGECGSGASFPGRRIEAKT